MRGAPWRNMADKAGCAGVLVTPASRPEEVHEKRGEPHVRFGLERGRDAAEELAMAADIRSFTQVQYAMNRRMVQTVSDWLRLGRHERLLDLYSGVGNFALPLALGCSEVVAVESSPFAHADSKENAARNVIYNVKHLPGDAGDWVKNLAAKSETFDAILLDPPRTGARGVLENFGHLGARRILYVSCNLPSLDRDLSDLRRVGYAPVRLQPWDLFPRPTVSKPSAFLKNAEPIDFLTGKRFPATLLRRAGIAQLAEHNLAKVGVAGSNPVSRSRKCEVRGRKAPFSLGRSRREKGFEGRGGVRSFQGAGANCLATRRRKRGRGPAPGTVASLETQRPLGARLLGKVGSNPVPHQKSKRGAPPPSWRSAPSRRSTDLSPLVVALHAG